MPFGDRDDGYDVDASLALLSAEEADDAAADRRLRPAGDADPEPEHRSTLLTVTPWILGNEFCERLAYYGCAALQRTCCLQLARVRAQTGVPAPSAVDADRLSRR